MPTIDYRPPEPPSDLKWQWEHYIKPMAILFLIVAVMSVWMIWDITRPRTRLLHPPPTPTTAVTSG